MTTTTIFDTILGGIIPLILQIVLGLFTGGLVL